MSYTIEFTRRVVSYWAESCRYESEVDHECIDDCTWLDGDSREVESPDEWEMDWPLDDEDDQVSWAIDIIERDVYVNLEANMSPVPQDVSEWCWLSGGYENMNGTMDEWTVRLTGEWTEQERGTVFRHFA